MHLNVLTMASLFLSGVVAGAGVELIPRVQQIVSAFGDVINSRFFSDLSVSLEIELKGEDVKCMYDALQTVMRMDEPKGDLSPPGVLVTAFLHVYFVYGRGELTVDTPVVPG
jgi:hypothetical protein